MSTEIKLYKDCKHYRFSLLSPFSGQFARCAALPLYIDHGDAIPLVTGRYAGSYASLQRGGVGKCGRDAKLFEAKP